MLLGRCRLVRKISKIFYLLSVSYIQGLNHLGSWEYFISIVAIVSIVINY